MDGEIKIKVLEVSRNIKNKVDSTEGKVDSTEGKVDSTEGKVDSTEGKVDSMEGKVNLMEGSMADKDSIIMEDKDSIIMEDSMEVSMVDLMVDSMADKVVLVEGSIMSIQVLTHIKFILHKVIFMFHLQFLLSQQKILDLILTCWIL